MPRKRRRSSILRGLKLFALLFLSGASLCEAAWAEDICAFDDWAWHSEKGQAMAFQSVKLPREDLSADQQHPDLPCSVCREDQETLTLSNGMRVTVCRVLAGRFERALEETLESGFQIQTLTGYRVGRTRGPLNDLGLRTKYSNHSFGVAIDINASANGLYSRCMIWGAACQLRRGGVWDPNNPLSIVPTNNPYLAFDSYGFLWGGKLEGRQKDFMHFSLTGD